MTTATPSIISLVNQARDFNIEIAPLQTLSCGSQDLSVMLRDLKCFIRSCNELTIRQTETEAFSLLAALETEVLYRTVTLSTLTYKHIAMCAWLAN